MAKNEDKNNDLKSLVFRYNIGPCWACHVLSKDDQAKPVAFFDDEKGYGLCSEHLHEAADDLDNDVLQDSMPAGASKDAELGRMVRKALEGKQRLNISQGTVYFYVEIFSPDDKPISHSLSYTLDKALAAALKIS